MSSSSPQAQGQASLLADAVKEWNDAYQAFNNADLEYLDYHIFRLQAAEERLNLVIRQLKLEHGVPLHARTPRFIASQFPANDADAPTTDNG